RLPDLYPGDPDQDDRPPHAGRGDGEDARLGGRRGRRLHADLNVRRKQSEATGARRCAPVNQAGRGDKAGCARCAEPAGNEGNEMVDAVIGDVRTAGGARKRSGFQKLLQRKSTIAFFMALPLISLIALLVIYPALYSLHLATLNKSMERFVGLGNFTFL